MLKSKRNFRLGVCGALLGAVYFGFAGSAIAWNEPLWVRQLGTEEGYDSGTGVATDAVGNVYVTGRSDDFDPDPGQSAGAWLAKYDAAGQVLWKRQLGTADSDYASGVATDAVGNVYVTGWSPVDAWLAKYDADGRLLWKRQLGGEYGTGVATDAVGNVYVSGWSADAWLAKYDADGRVLWKRQFGTGISSYSASGVATDAGGNVYLSGTRRAHKEAAWLVKYDAAGHVLWKRELGSESSFDSAAGVATDVAGNVYLTGSTDGSLGGANRGRYDAWVAKYDAAGHVLWKRQLGTEDHDWAGGVATDVAGNVYLAGRTLGSLGGANGGGLDAWVAKYDTAGHVLWKRQFGTEDDDSAYGVTTDTAGNVYLTGDTGFPMGGDKYGLDRIDALVIKYSTQR